MNGLGLLDIETTLLPDKTLTRVTATHVASGQKIEGYEIHLGASHGPDCSRPFARIGGADDGATSADGLVSGTYIHGCFASDGFRSAYLKTLGAAASDLAFESLIEKTLDELAAHLEQHLDLDQHAGTGRRDHDPAFCRGGTGPLRRAPVRLSQSRSTTRSAIPSNGSEPFSQNSKPCFTIPKPNPCSRALRGVAALLALLLIAAIPAVLVASVLSTFRFGWIIEALLATTLHRPALPAMSM